MQVACRKNETEKFFMGVSVSKIEKTMPWKSEREKYLKPINKPGANHKPVATRHPPSLQCI